MSSLVREVNVTWCPACGKSFDVPVDRFPQRIRPTRREKTLECPRCGCRQCLPKQRPRISRPLNDNELPRSKQRGIGGNPQKPPQAAGYWTSDE
jgi:hypothetical protein